MGMSEPGKGIVEAGWQKVRADGRVRTELLDAAYAEPRLRQLFPWTGMGELHFSRRTGFGWTWDIPYIQPAAGGGYWVSGPCRNEAVGPAAMPAQPSRWWWSAYRPASGMPSWAARKNSLPMRRLRGSRWGHCG